MTPDDIKKARANAGLTQSEAAKLLYVTKNCWQKWEAGDRAMPRAMFEHFLCLTTIPRTGPSIH